MPDSAFNELDEINDIPLSLIDKIAGLPAKPGIYQYKNADAKIIYIGKAKNLKNRVKSYFQKGRPQDAKTKALVGKIVDLEVILVDSEAEALILEDILIKKHKPRYNIMLRDDKTYPYIRITNEPFPRVFPTRKVIRDGSKYFGPFTDGKNIKHLMRILRSMFLIRDCELKITEDAVARHKFKVCLNYHIKKCEGPCEGFISKELYNENIRQAAQILTGKTKDLEKHIEDLMFKYSEEMRFEDAAYMKNRLNSIKEYSAKQKVVSSDLSDRDVFGMARIDDSACTIALMIRDGKLIGKRHFTINNCELETDETLIQKTLEKWYLESDFVPKDIFLPCEIDDMEYITDWLGKKRGKGLTISIPKLGDKKKMVEMASLNADFILKEYLCAYDKRDQAVPKSVTSLQRDLRLTKLPKRIECFDNSHIQGSELVSSMVVFVDGKPKKSEYRKYIVKTVEGNNDFAAMQETIRRRYSRAVAEKTELPDLIIVDGGKGQLSSAYTILCELGLEHIAVIGLAKRLEEVFFPGISDSTLLPRTSSSLRLIQNLRDEAHRFAITFHRLLRDKRTLQTELTVIAGIGEKSAVKLLTEFGSVKGVAEADIEDLSKIVSRKAAEDIKEYFNNKNSIQSK